MDKLQTSIFEKRIFNRRYLLQKSADQARYLYGFCCHFRSIFHRLNFKDSFLEEQMKKILLITIFIGLMAAANSFAAGSDSRMFQEYTGSDSTQANAPIP